MLFYKATIKICSGKNKNFLQKHQNMFEYSFKCLIFYTIQRITLQFDFLKISQSLKVKNDADWNTIYKSYNV